MLHCLALSLLLVLSVLAAPSIAEEGIPFAFHESWDRDSGEIQTTVIFDGLILRHSAFDEFFVTVDELSDKKRDGNKAVIARFEEVMGKGAPKGIHRKMKGFLQVEGNTFTFSGVSVKINLSNWFSETITDVEGQIVDDVGWIKDEDIVSIMTSFKYSLTDQLLEDLERILPQQKGSGPHVPDDNVIIEILSR